MFNDSSYDVVTAGSTAIGAATAALLSIAGSAPEVVDNHESRIYGPEQQVYVADFSDASGFVQDKVAIEPLESLAQKSFDAFCEHFSNKMIETPLEFGKAIDENFFDLI